MRFSVSASFHTVDYCLLRAFPSVRSLSWFNNLLDSWYNKRILGYPLALRTNQTDNFPLYMVSISFNESWYMMSISFNYLGMGTNRGPWTVFRL